MNARYWTILAAATGLLALLTLVVPDWIEAVFHIDPDGGSGLLEMVIVLALTAACVLSTRKALRAAAVG